ncbi:MAG: tRNA (adenosine(37)-N6)-threonylcarbamoyltransferase complex ATPase subunit type 1 TsaE [Candidatus Paceibacterota bacterium]|nr:MAG: tRNA (adenosine(37)-N6)-threonylcarbamoyltransferase complex ATPase subunit type 1 TsaE [Candidatus Paceibacterota bacterium]
MKFISKSLKETDDFAKNLVKLLYSKQQSKQAVIICLSGELGAGKTTLVKSLAKALGIKEHITSPTFVILKRYKINTPSFKNLIHIDAYRLKSGSELLSLGWQDIVSEQDNLVFIEWPENVISVIPKGAVIIRLRVVNESEREIKSIKNLNLGF